MAAGPLVDWPTASPYEASSPANTAVEIRAAAFDRPDARPFDRLGERAFVEPVDTVLGDRSIRLRQVVLHERRAGRRGRAIFAEQHGLRGRKPGQRGAVLRDAVGVRLVDLEPIVGQLFAGFQQPGQWQATVLANHFIVGRQRAWHAAGERADLAQTRIGLAVAHIHIASRFGRGHFAAVDREQLSVRPANQDETPAADSRVVTVDHA